MAETLPTDILENIFSRLQFEPALQCKRVCKTWRTIVGNSVGILFTFEKTTPSSRTKDHVTQLYYGDPRYETKVEKYYSENTLTPLVSVPVEPNGMVGSCNGLVCFKEEYPIYSRDGCAVGVSLICNNPITGEAVYFPGLGCSERSLKPPVGGFGYVGSTNEYKVVRICFKYLGASCIQVYTLGSHLGWRDKGNVPDPLFIANESGVFANGALHWINVNGCIQMILAFGLADEEFCPIPSPPYFRGLVDCRSSKLVLLGGNLCAIHTNNQSINKRLDIWVIKTSYGKEKGKQSECYYDDTWSWSKEYSITWEGKVMYTPFVITRRDTILLWQNGTSNLYCYDPKSSTLQKYWDGDNRDNVYAQAIPHMNSLVSLEDLGET